jgi:hypothetical protein
VILVSIVAIVRKHQVRRSDRALELLEQHFDRRAFVRKKAIAETVNAYVRLPCTAQETTSALSRLAPARGIRAEHHPVHFHRRVLLNEVENQTSASDLDVVSVCPKAQEANSGAGSRPESEITHVAS